MKTVLITGGSKGIGASTAMCFAKHGYNIIITYNNSFVDATNVKNSIESMYQVSVFLIKCDIGNEVEIKNMQDIITEKYESIDVIVNNAGIAIDTVYDQKTKDNFMKILEVNLVGTFLVTKYMAKLIKNGSIVNVSSTNGIDSNYVESLDYDASKAGVILLTRNLAHQYAPNIRVNTVAPGWVLTPMNENLDNDFINKENKKTLLGRFADASEIANAIYFLASNEASFITGTVLRVDGGYNE